MTEPHSEHHPRRRRKALLWASVGAIVALAVGCVLLGAGLAAKPQSAAITSPPLVALEPGINAGASTLLQLDPLSAPLSASPPLSLTDQYGHPLALSQFRGKSVVLSFNDDKCEDLCTLLAQDVVAADSYLGAAAKDVVFLSVNANPYYPSAGSVKQWTDQHGLAGVANWVFGTGLPAKLAAAAQAYGVPIQLDPAARSVVHGSELFFIDPRGREAALGQFGAESASTALFGRAMAQMAVDLLPNAASIHVSGPAPANPGIAAAAQLNQEAPGFSLPQLADPTADTSLDSMRGKYTVVNFWSSTCTACVQEMPAMEQAHKDLGKNVDFVGIDVADHSSDALDFAAKYGVGYPLLSDQEGTVAGAYQVSGLPFTAVIGPDGNMLVRHPGAMTAEQLDYVMQTLMDE